MKMSASKRSSNSQFTDAKEHGHKTKLESDQTRTSDPGQSGCQWLVSRDDVSGSSGIVMDDVDKGPTNENSCRKCDLTRSTISYPAAHQTFSIHQNCVNPAPSHTSPAQISALTLVVPDGKRSHMYKLIKPLFCHMTAWRNVIELREDHESFPFVDDTATVPHYTVMGDEMSAPALAVMIFVPEQGQGCVTELRSKFIKFPWRHHHTIQLQSSRSTCVVGSQEFYFLSRQLPLWSVCPSGQTSRRVRFNVFVRRYNAMVEFYRLVTGTEMESSKPGFCLFPLNTGFLEGEAATPCELALKHCSHVNPYPLSHAYLVLPVYDVTSLRHILKTEFTPLDPRHYLIHDPDGNPIVLRDVTVTCVPHVINRVPNLSQSENKRTDHVVDKVSVHSDSIDSGRFSDFDACSAELDHYMSQLVRVCYLGGTQTNSRIDDNKQHNLPNVGQKQIVYEKHNPNFPKSCERHYSSSHRYGHKHDCLKTNRHLEKVCGANNKDCVPENFDMEDKCISTKKGAGSKGFSYFDVSGPG